VIEMNREMKVFMFAALAILMASACFMIYDSEDSDAASVTIGNGQTKSFNLINDLGWYDEPFYEDFELQFSLYYTHAITNKSDSVVGTYGGNWSTVTFTLPVLAKTGNATMQLDVVNPDDGEIMDTTSKTITVTDMNGQGTQSSPFTSINYFVYSSNGNPGSSTMNIYVAQGASFKVSESFYASTSMTAIGSSTSVNSLNGITKSTSGTRDTYQGTLNGNVSIKFNTQYTLNFYAVSSGSSTNYTCYLYYNANGGSGAPSTQSYSGTSTSSHSFTVSSTTPTRSGYTFLGWSTNSSATSATYSGGDSISVSYNGSKTLYAVWQQNVTSYTCYLYYDANGGSGAPSTQSYTGSSTSNHSFTISNTQPTRSGYTFLGWSTSSSATSASYSGGDSISVGYKSSKTLYAVWQEQVTTYIITIYKGNWDSFKLLSDGTKYTTSSHTYTINAGSTIDVDWYGKDIESGSGTNYTYTTTYTNHEYNMASSLYGSSLGDSVTPTGNAKYYPATQMTSNTVYTYSYTIKYNANGGSGAPSNTTDTSSSASKSITLSSTIPTRSGYNFLGWSKSSTATSASYSAGSSYTFDYGTTNLYAVWKEATITVSGTPDAYGVVGSAWSFKPTVSVDGCSVTISGASWLSANGTNVSGTPTTSGTYNVTLTFSKTGYTSATKTFSITVLSALSFESSPTGGAIIYAV